MSSLLILFTHLVGDRDIIKTINLQILKIIQKITI